MFCNNLMETTILLHVCGDLKVSGLSPGASGPGLSPGWGHCEAFLGRHLTLTAPLCTQVYKWVPANLMLGVTLQWNTVQPKNKACARSGARCSCAASTSKR